MSNMENMYSRELELIEKTLKEERNALVNSFQKKWDILYKQQENEDAAGDEKRRKIMKEYEEEMETVMTEHDEDYRALKIELERECQDLQQQVEKTKALCLLNAEKLSYNYTVLKSREEENSIVKSQQKRKINKLVGLINSLKKNYSDLEENTKLEIEKLSSQVLKAHKNITELEEKSIHFTRVNEKQYIDIWNMNTENANELIKKISAADRLIHERTLGILWDPPEKSLPKKDDLPSYCTAMNVIQKRKQDEMNRIQIFEQNKAERTSSEIQLERQILNNILKQISNCSGYLIEDKLQELISNRSEEEKTIIKLDNVFQALSISTPEEINMLLDFFLPYAYCPICSAKESTISEISKSPTTTSKTTSCNEICDGCKDENVRKLVDAVKQEIDKQESSQDYEESQKISSLPSDSLNSEISLNEDYEDRSEDERDYKSEDKSDYKKSKRFTCDNGHVLEIQAAHVTKAMKELVTKCTSAEQKGMVSFEQRLRERKYTISRNLSPEDVKNYWSSYREIFGVQKEKLWDAILIGLNKYYEVLKERHKLCNETETLRKQNAELQRLLESHTSSSEDSLSLLQVKSAKHSAYK